MSEFRFARVGLEPSTRGRDFARLEARPTGMTQTSRVRAISFDGDMTLWDFEEVMRHSFAITLQELRRRVPSPRTATLTIDKMIEIRNQVTSELGERIVDLEEIRLEAFRRTLEHAGCRNEDLAADLNSIYLRHRFEDVELYGDVLPTLRGLRSELLVGLLSNGNGYPKRSGLRDRFDFVTLSQEVGVQKPDERIFAAACAQAGCRTSELLHVGDSLESDVVGARRAGARSVWLNRPGVRNDRGIEADHEIRRLTDLFEIVDLV